MYRHFFSGAIATLYLLVSAPLSADSDQQSLFLDVEKSLKRGKSALYLEKRTQLDSYPLIEYLDYLHLTNRFKSIEQSDINQFVHRHHGLPQSRQLQYQWLSWLAKKKRWSDYLQAYDEADQSIKARGGRYQCLKGKALLSLGEKTSAWKEAENLWLVGKSQDKACDPLFAHWRDAGMLTQSLAVTRFWLAVSQGNTSLARYIDRHIAQPSFKASTQLFWRIHNKPELLTSTPQLNGAIEHHRLIMLHGIKRLSSYNRDQGLRIWLKLRSQHPFKPEQVAQLDRRLAMKYAKNFDEDAETHITHIDPEFKNPEITEWRIRLALTDGNWQQVLELIQKLPDAYRTNNRWTYWHSVAQLKQAGSSGGFLVSPSLIQHNNVLAKLSQSRSFYGFLVADLGQQPFQMNHENSSVHTDDLDNLEYRYPAFARIQAWLSLGRTYKAQSELNHLSPRLTTSDRKLLPYLAQRMDWHHQAIMGAAKVSLWNDLDLRFPTPESQLFSKHAKLRGLDFPWVVSIARQESAFNPMARSHAGARGLMQLMPATAKQTARKHRIPYKNTAELYQPDKNIAIGTAHLSWLSKKFENNRVFVTAAYNAGSHRVKRWLKARGHLPLDVWIETIPYDETRNYVQNVLAFRVIYSQRSNQNVRMFSPGEAANLSLAPVRYSLIVQNNP